MAYGGYDLDQDYFAIQVNQQQETVDQIVAQSTSFPVGSSAGQFALWNGTGYVPGTFFTGNGIGAAYTATPSMGVQFAINDGAAVRTAIGMGIKAIATGTLSAVDPGSIAATSTGTVTATITGAATADVVALSRPSGLHDDLIFSGCRVTGADTLTIYLYNPTAGAIDDGANDWQYVWFDAA